MYDDYHDEIEFLVIYGLEPHPTDEWWLGESATLRFFHRMLNSEASLEIAQPTTLAERQAAAANAHQQLFNNTIPLYVDTIDNQVFALYAGRPMRFYLIDQEGFVVFEQELADYLLRPNELEKELAKLAVSPEPVP